MVSSGERGKQRGYGKRVGINSGKTGFKILRGFRTTRGGTQGIEAIAMVRCGIIAEVGVSSRSRSIKGDGGARTSGIGTGWGYHKTANQTMTRGTRGTCIGGC
jgi:hypothetical protein